MIPVELDLNCWKKANASPFPDFSVDSKELRLGLARQNARFRSLIAIFLDSVCTMSQKSDKNAVVTLQPLGHFCWPSMPTQDAVGGLINRTKLFFAQDQIETPYIAEASLQRATRGVLETVVAPPACGPVLREMDQTFADWIHSPTKTSRLQLVILPPCDSNSVLEAWATKNHYEILEPPDRGSIVSNVEHVLPEFSGDGLLVIPRLERWFLRHQDGLVLIRKLLNRLATLDRMCVIGCNSWAWQLLCKVLDADLILPKGLTFCAFDGDRLREWFSELADDESFGLITFKLSKNGQTVLTTDGNDGSTNYFKQLAAHSLGIPWVAWHHWRRSLRSRSGDDQQSLPAVSDELPETLWIAALEEYTLPNARVDETLLVLHALLIHTTLTIDELNLVMPTVLNPGVVLTLANADIIIRNGDEFCCSPAAYPSIRRGLAASGFPLDEL